MTLSSLLWLYPIVFMFHDFEEIIMMRPWMQKNAPRLYERFPRLAGPLGHTERLSTSAFALAVAEEFVLIAALTWPAVEYGWYSFWAGMVAAFFIHLIVHIGQAAALRSYTPAVLTSVPAAVYCMLAFLRLYQGCYLDLGQFVIWTTIATLVMVANLAFALWLAGRFDAWLEFRFR